MTMFFAILGLQFEEVALVGELDDQFLDVIGLGRIIGYQAVERELFAGRRVFAGPDRWLLAVVGRQEVEEAPGVQQHLDIIFQRQVGNAGARTVGDGAAKLLGCDFLVRDGLHHVRTGDEHVGAVLHHEHEIGDGRRVDGAAGAGTHDQRDLRDHAGGEHVALEDLGIAAQRSHAFLDACAAGIVEADDRCTDLHRLVHDLADLFGMRFGQGAAKYREVLAEHEYQPAVDGAVTDDHAVTDDLLVGHAEVGAAMLDEHVPFFEAALVEQQVDALAGAQLALGMLGVDPLLASAELGGGALVLQLLEDGLHACTPVRKYAEMGEFMPVQPVRTGAGCG